MPEALNLLQTGRHLGDRLDFVSKDPHPALRRKISKESSQHFNCQCVVLQPQLATKHHVASFPYLPRWDRGQHRGKNPINSWVQISTM